MVGSNHGSSRQQSIASLESAVRKTRKALVQMTGKGAATGMVEKRLKALQIGLEALEGGVPSCPGEELMEARAVLSGLLPSMRAIKGRMKAGSAQLTLLNRRIDAVELAIEVIDAYPGLRKERVESNIMKDRKPTERI